VQKPLYPEGQGVCHTIVVHPPGGIAGGDELQISARLKTHAHALLTTPGAGKWYRSLGSWARQSVVFDLESGASLEWLPQEDIIFNGAHAELRTTARLSGDANFIGWEIYCLGRAGSGERISTGRFRWRTLIERDSRPLWFENARFEGGDESLQSAVVLAGQTVVGTLLATSLKLDTAALIACRQSRPVSGNGRVTLLPGAIVGRYLGASSEAAKIYFTALWRILRPSIMSRQAVEPRIWQT
jgi:urease accessory protein